MEKIIEGYISIEQTEQDAKKRGYHSGSAWNLDTFSGCSGWVYVTGHGHYLIPGGEVPFKTIGLLKSKAAK